MIFTIAALYYLANSINLTSPMNYISPMNLTTSTIISDSVNYTQNMLNSFNLQPYRNQFIILQERIVNDPSAAILFTYAASFFVIASMLYIFSNRNKPPQLVKSYHYESEEEEDNNDMDYTFNIYVRNRKVKWTPHPMIRRSMDSYHKDE